MAFPWIYFGGNKGPLLRNALTSLESDRDRFFNSRADIFRMRDTMIQMRSGDGSQASHYAQLTIQFAFVDDDSAKAAFDEIASACGVMENSASTAATINAALSQLFAKLRG